MASGTIKGTKQGYYGVEIDWVATANSASANTSTVVSKNNSIYLSNDELRMAFYLCGLLPSKLITPI